MAPRKSKTQAKRNNVKVKSKSNSKKRETKIPKKVVDGEKALNNLKWLNKAVAEGSVKKCEALPVWYKNGSYKHKHSSNVDISEYEEYPQQEEEEKSSVSDASEECNCSHTKYPENDPSGARKTELSENNLVSKYIKSGMHQVASFIVESAIRFGEQHGVVIPDKNTPNLYEITPPDSRFSEKCRKIRFKIPEKNDDEWKNHDKKGQSSAKRAETPMPEWGFSQPTKSSSWESTPDSLEEILPILEKLKQEGDIVTSDLDLEKLRKAEENMTKDKEWLRGWERERDRERVRTDRGLRDRIRSLKKRYKSLDRVSEKGSEDNDYPEGRTRWKKCRRDSLELGRQRLRAGTSRKPERMTPPPFLN